MEQMREPRRALESASQLDERSLHLRRLVAKALKAANKGHVGSALSLIEILRVLYDSVVRHDPTNPTWPERDRVILSKGHGCLALYAVLTDLGYLSIATLESFCARNSPLGGHPERQLELGIEASTGALGHGLPIAVGIALASRMKGNGVRVFVVVGDGELNEGSNWEALLLASKHSLANLTVVVDHNAQQLHGPISKVLPLNPLKQKFEAFGAIVCEVDGHSPSALLEAFNDFSSRSEGPPGVIICHTIKGKGLSFAEHNPAWHYQREFLADTLHKISDQLAGKVVGNSNGSST